jgi:alkanesulfonate monooxygenase SsuD/methylene tetrahydromethanopterin reductase-like flavin-dependent oxidoreductase (luciferase family)
MKLGVALPMAGAWATPENQIRVAQRAEALGYHSLWVFQRLLYALARRTITRRYPASRGQRRSGVPSIPSSRSPTWRAPPRASVSAPAC